LTRGTRAFASALLLTLGVSSCGPQLPLLGNLSYLAPREQRGSILANLDTQVGTHRIALHELQLKGSHNSYHRAPRIALSRSWRYSHAPLDVQLAQQGVRQLELDVRYAAGELMVGHLPLVDGRSTCHRFADCLARVKEWSRAHPKHLPVFVLIEVKEDLAPSDLDGKLDAIDFAITRVLSRDMLLMPEDVAGDSPSLREAIIARGWPSVDDARGRIAFVMFGPGRHKRAYSAGRPRLDGRVMFVAERDTTRPHTSVVFYDDPIRMRALIADAVKQHFLVRTRADENLVRSTRRRDAALSSGANFVSSDFVDPRFNWLEIGPYAAGRCNPLSATRACGASTVSELDQPTVALSR
jgi:Phosphoinositide phospholipase C, Ca2+-dependent